MITREKNKKLHIVDMTLRDSCLRNKNNQSI